MNMPVAQLARNRLVAVVVLLAAEPMFSQTTEQTISLHPGWNAIALHVDPTESRPAVVFGATTYDSVWAYLPPPSSEVEGRWLVHRREGPEFADSLRGISGGRAYLVHVSENETLIVRGRPVPPGRPLVGNTFQLYCADVDPAAPPTTAEYFSRSNVVGKIGALFGLRTDGYQPLGTGDEIAANQALWILPRQNLGNPHPLRIRTGISGLRFGSAASVQALVLDLPVKPNEHLLKIRATTSGGKAPSWLEYNDEELEWKPLAGAVTIPIAAGESIVEIRLRAVRSSSSEAEGVGPLDDRNAVIEVTGANGSRAVVTAQLELPVTEGLWVGEALVDEVSQPSIFGGGFATAPSQRLTLLLEIPESGAPRILDRARVRTDRDGRPFDLRLISGFFHEPVTLTGALSAGGDDGELSGTIAIPSDHALNPYRHRYQPEHRHGYALERKLTLRFSANDPDPIRSDLAVSSVGLLHGSFLEELQGLSPEPIRIRGTFRLRRFVSLTELTTE